MKLPTLPERSAVAGITAILVSVYDDMIPCISVKASENMSRTSSNQYVWEEAGMISWKGKAGKINERLPRARWRWDAWRDGVRRRRRLNERTGLRVWSAIVGAGEEGRRSNPWLMT